jgi:hypothetical protein
MHTLVVSVRTHTSLIRFPLISIGLLNNKNVSVVAS